jgi:predicted dehydrogenase
MRASWRRPVAASDALFVLTHNYSGYPMIRQAREMVRNATSANPRRADGISAGLAGQKIEDSGQKQAEWRTDPARSGLGGAIGDIGTHAFHLGNFVTGLERKRFCADLDSFVEGRQLDDNCHVLLRYKGGAKGMLWASQVAPGHENGLMLADLRREGRAGVGAERPELSLAFAAGAPRRLITRGGAGAGAAGGASRVSPAAIPEGYLEGFATIYTEAAEAIRAPRRQARSPKACSSPTSRRAGRAWPSSTACVDSSRRGGVRTLSG